MIGRNSGRRPTLYIYPPISRGSLVACPPREILKMRTFGDAFSLILWSKSRAFRTDFYQVTGNKVMMNWSVDCFYCLLISY